MTLKRWALAAALVVALAGAGWAATRTAGPDWAFPGPGLESAAHGDPWLNLPGTSVRYRKSVIEEGSTAIDWRPASHPPMPSVVARAKPGAMPCGYCHLPDGQGRPENASLAGLPAEYIRHQVEGLASGQRTGARPRWGPTGYMAEIARSVSRRDLAEAAAYFARLNFVSHVDVIETARPPKVQAHDFVYVRVSRGPESRAVAGIIEIPRDMSRFDLRDPRATYIAYVPPGAVARGAALVRTGGPAGVACTSCHGARLEGAAGPPLAGRFPTYLFRQLVAFQTGGRRGPTAAPMLPIAARLTQEQMVDLAAYAASLGRRSPSKPQVP